MRGILKTGKKFSLDSTMDLVNSGGETAGRQTIAFGDDLMKEEISDAEEDSKWF